SATSEASNRQIRRGFQYRRKIAVAIREIKPPAMSVRGKALEWAKKYWQTANEPPAMRMAGQTSKVSFHPHMHRTSQNGTMQERNGSWFPAISLSFCASRFVTLC